MSGSMGETLAQILGPDRVRRDVPLAPMTTYRVGGPADWFVEPEAPGELGAVMRAARDAGVAVTVLGGGSNVLVADRGIRGVVVRYRGRQIATAGGGQVEADAGVSLNELVRWTIHHGLGGLAPWAGTPGTVGGAVAGNAHWAGVGIGTLVRRATVVTPAGAVVELDAGDLAFAYDSSRLQGSGEILVRARFGLVAGADPAGLRAIARASLAARKRSQPLGLPSAGCVFQNPDPATDPLPPGIPASAGALIDRAGLKGHAVGGARVSDLHANFIVTSRGATAADVRALVARCRDEVERRWGVRLREEIVSLGEFEAMSGA